jgi:hypothetical protein
MRSGFAWGYPTRASWRRCCAPRPERARMANTDPARVRPLSLCRNRQAPTDFRICYPIESIPFIRFLPTPPSENGRALLESAAPLSSVPAAACAATQ